MNKGWLTWMGVVVVIGLFAHGSAAAQDKSGWTKTQAEQWVRHGDWKKGLTPKPHASVDAVDFAIQYHRAPALWEKVFGFLKTTNLDSLPAGKYPIDGDNAFAIVTEGTTKPLEQTKWESHKAYIDLHYVIHGQERIGEAALDKATLTEPFTPGNDNAHYDAEGTFYDVQPGTFLLFFPENVHRAGIRVEGSPNDKKLVIKIRYTPAASPTVMLDYYFNNEWHKDAKGDSVRFHYTWEDEANSGFSKLGGLFKDAGFALTSLTTAPTPDNLRLASVYVIVDPDTRAESPDPHYVSAADIIVLKEWVAAGGVLVLMGNDKGNAEFEHFNHLAEIFGIHFNEDCVNHVVGEDIVPGEIHVPAGNAVFPKPVLLYMKDVSSLRLEAPAAPLLVNAGAVLAATAAYGKGTVFAVGDPWIYNEYIDSHKLPAEIGNMDGATAWVGWLKSVVR